MEEKQPLTDIMDDLQATKHLREAFVKPFYLKCLGANFVRSLTDDDQLREHLVEAASTISDQDLERLLEVREWRGRLTAAWFIGLTRRASFVQRIAELLISSETVYAGRGYCFALGVIGGPECGAHLRTYLKKYLPFHGRVYDQEWAIGALTYLEGAPPTEFLDPSLWINGTEIFDPSRGIRQFKEIVDFIYRNNMTVPDTKLHRM
jgi:hypothetical protein